jgi:hypothetical protein
MNSSFNKKKFLLFICNMGILCNTRHLLNKLSLGLLARIKALCSLLFYLICIFWGRFDRLQELISYGTTDIASSFVWLKILSTIFWALRILKIVITLKQLLEAFSVFFVNLDVHPVMLVEVNDSSEKFPISF